MVNICKVMFNVTVVVLVVAIIIFAYATIELIFNIGLFFTVTEQDIINAQPYVLSGFVVFLGIMGCIYIIES